MTCVGRKYLRSMLIDESRAYGFTIAFWGAGVVLIEAFGVPDMLEALTYGFGAVVGFGLLALTTFDKPTRTVDRENPKYPILATIHYLASLLPILIAGGLVELLPPLPAFFIAGMTVSIMYNLLSLLEEDISELLV